MLPLNLSDTAATSQDGSSLQFIAAIARRQCYIQDASGRGLCWTIKFEIKEDISLLFTVQHSSCNGEDMVEVACFLSSLVPQYTRVNCWAALTYVD